MHTKINFFVYFCVDKIEFCLNRSENFTKVIFVTRANVVSQKYFFFVTEVNFVCKLVFGYANEFSKHDFVRKPFIGYSNRGFFLCCTVISLFQIILGLGFR